MQIIPMPRPSFTPFYLTALFFLFLMPQVSSAQMFSVGDTESTREPVPLGLQTTLSAGWETASFDYTGSGSLTDLQRLDFDDNLFRVRLESPGLDLSLGFGGGLTGMNQHSLVNVNGRIFNDIPVFIRERVRLRVPIQLTTDLLSVRRNESDQEFQQSSLVFGTGLASAFRLGSGIDLTLRATPNYGFSFSQGNLFGGSKTRLDGRAQFLFHDLIGRHSLSLSYHFDYRRYKIEGDQNDYDFTSHSISIGYIF